MLTQSSSRDDRLWDTNPLVSALISQLDSTHISSSATLKSALSSGPNDMLFDQFCSRGLAMKVGSNFSKWRCAGCQGGSRGGGAEKFGADFIPHFLIKMN